MGEISRIEWTDATWNPVTGCTKVSQGCKNCYAERDWARLVHLPAYHGRAFTDVECHPERLDQPLRWKRPRRIFVNSMSDLFHPDVPDEFIDRVFAVMALANQHNFQVLTKRPRRMLDYCKTLGKHNGIDRVSIAAQQISSKTWFLWHKGDVGWNLPNVHLGVSVEDQLTADERIPPLLQTPAAVRWISAEPLLGTLMLEMMPSPHERHYGWPGTYNSLAGSWWPAVGDYEEEYRRREEGLTKIDWVVAGGESGPKARPTHPDWFRSLRDQCKAAGVPFLFKQWGEWSPQEDTLLHGKIDARLIEKAHIYYGTAAGFCPAEGVFRFGKKAAGRHLDSVLHDEYPEDAK